MLNEELTVELLETKSLIERELSKFVNRLENKLSPQVEYALLSGGKRLRPLIVLLAAQSVGGDLSKAVPLALAFELTHTSSLVHDDIIDGDVFRRGKLALHNNWSANSAILTGDLLIACAVYLVSSYGEKIIKTISQSTIELCQGEQMDLMLGIGSTEKEYFQMIESKSASLFQAAGICGAIVGGASPNELDSLSNFGNNFGIAYQLRDDILDLQAGEGGVSKDLKKGRVTLPLVHLFNLSNPSERESINEDFRGATKLNGVKSDMAVKAILKKLEEAGSVTYAEKKLDEYFQLTMASLTPLKDSPYKQSLLQMSNLLKGAIL